MGLKHERGIYPRESLESGFSIKIRPKNILSQLLDSSWPIHIIPQHSCIKNSRGGETRPFKLKSLSNHWEFYSKLIPKEYPVYRMVFGNFHHSMGVSFPHLYFNVESSMQWSTYGALPGMNYRSAFQSFRAGRLVCKAPELGLITLSLRKSAKYSA